MFSASRRRAIREHNDRAWSAWTVARLGRAKKIPALKTLEVKERRVQTWQEQFAIMQTWAAQSQLAEEMRRKLDGR